MQKEEFIHPKIKIINRGTKVKEKKIIQILSKKKLKRNFEGFRILLHNFPTN